MAHDMAHDMTLIDSMLSVPPHFFRRFFIFFLKALT